MAEIILEPTALSKVIPLKFKINDVDVPKTTQLSTNKQFNTTDTDAWFTFELDGLASTSGTYDLTLINLDDKSIFHHADVLFAALPFHYKLNSSEDVTLNEIRHAGRWLGQLVVTMANGDTTARQFGFNISGHILDGQDAQVILLSDYQALINTINLAKDDLAQYNVDYAALIADVTTAEGLREQAEIAREAALNALIASGTVDLKVAEKYQEIEALNAPEMVSFRQQLEQADTSIIGSKHLTDTMFLSAKENSLKFIPNSETYLAIPTPDATNQTVHPKVLYFKDGWNGYKFWMAHTPYAFADNTLENPCIAVSNDGTTWIDPPGLTNPIDPKPVGTGNYNSDVHILMRDNVMECWWRAVISEQTVIKRKTSTDGITWSESQTMITTTTSGCLSPAILYEDAKYKMWFVDGNIIKYVESANGDTLAGARTLDIQYTFDANVNAAWHIDVIKTNELIEMLIYVRPEGTLHYATSSDNVNFSLGVEVVRPRYYDTTMFDCKSTYRSSLVRVGDLYYVYYTGIMFDNAHHIGLVKGHSMDKLGLSSSKEITIYADGNSHTAMDSIQKYKKYAITTTNITYLMQATFPEAKPGQLITDNSIPEYGRQTQKYVLYNSDTYYTRRTKADGTWTVWVKHNSTETVDYISDTVTPSTPIADYPKDKVSYHIIGSDHGVANAFPEYSGGLLTTYNIKSAEAFWQYQTFVTYQYKHYYIRFVNTDGNWSGWNLIDTNFNGTTANRPTSARRVKGMCYFDHTLLKPIWWDGTNWRDATGTVVV